MKTRLADWFPWLVVLVLLTGCPHPPGSSDENNPLVQEAIGLSATDPQRAIQLLERALEGNPKLARAHRELGNLYYQQKTNGYAAAIYHYEKYLQLEKDTKWDDIIRAQIHQSKVDLARSVMEPMTDLTDQRRVQSLLAENERLEKEVNRLMTNVAILTAQLQQRGAGGSTTPAGTPGASTRPRPGAAGAVQPLTTATGPENAPTASPTKYQLKAGETLAKLSRRFGVSLEAMMQANPGIDYRKMRVGQEINLPPGTRP